MESKSKELAMARQSLIEEFQAIDWYQERIQAANPLLLSSGTGSTRCLRHQDEASSKPRANAINSVRYSTGMWKLECVSASISFCRVSRLAWHMGQSVTSASAPASWAAPKRLPESLRTTSGRVMAKLPPQQSVL